MPNKEGTEELDPGATQPALSQPDVNRLAHLATFEGLRTPGDDEHPDAASIENALDLVTVQQPQVQDFGSDDTGDFHRAHLDGGIYVYDD